MKTETVEEFLARGGKVEKSTKESTLEQLLYNEGIMGKTEVEEMKASLNEQLVKNLEAKVPTE
jgi:hypothetical protein